MKDYVSNLKSLGSGKTKYPTSYDPKVLEKFESTASGDMITVGLDAFEFSSLCPLTNQPDMGTIHIQYIPDEWMVESKSLKLYLFSFRNHGAFHEDCVATICRDLFNLLEPRYIEVYGDFNSRGGVSILPLAIQNHELYQDFADRRRSDIMTHMMNRKHN